VCAFLPIRFRARAPLPIRISLRCLGVGCTVMMMGEGRGPDLRSSPCLSRTLLRAFTATTTTLRPRPSVGPSVTFWVVVSTGNFFFKRVFFPLTFFPVVNHRRWSFTHFCWSVAHPRFAFPGQTDVRDQPYGGSKSRLGGRTNTHGRTCSCTTSFEPSPSRRRWVSRMTDY